MKNPNPKNPVRYIRYIKTLEEALAFKHIKEQQYQIFTKKLLGEGRITRAELKTHFPKKRNVLINKDEFE